jgi:hypothetical protein
VTSAPFVHEQRFTPWPIVRHRLMPLMLVVGFAQLMITSLNLPQVQVQVILFIEQFALAIIAGYEARHRGGSYRNALDTLWAMNLAWFGLMVLLLPLQLLAAHRTANPLPSGTAWVGGPVGILVAVLFVAVLLPFSFVLGWLVGIPFALLGAWIAPEPD